MNPQPGDVAFSGRYSPDLYDRIVMWATKSRWSHCFAIPGMALGELAVIEADLEVCMSSFAAQYIVKQQDYYEIWRPIQAQPADIAAAGTYCFDVLGETTYGFLQPLWYLARSLLAKVGIKLVNNWFTSGLVCSGLWYEYVKRLGPAYAETLVQYNSTNCDPQQLYNIVKSRPDLWQLVTQRN